MPLFLLAASPLALKLGMPATVPSVRATPVTMRDVLTAGNMVRDDAQPGWSVTDGGKISGTVVRNMNGLVVPTNAATAALEAATGGAVGRPVEDEVCTMGGGRVSGTFVRNANGLMIVSDNDEPAPPTTKTITSPISKGMKAQLTGGDVCRDDAPPGWGVTDGGKISGTVVRHRNGIAVPSVSAAAAAPAPAPELTPAAVDAEEA